MSISKRAKQTMDFKPPLPITNSTVLINPDELEFVRSIGVGSSGEVYEMLWKSTRVAVKKIFRTVLDGDVAQEFHREMDMLRRLRHPNIVLFMGTCVQGRDLCIYRVR